MAEFHGGGDTIDDEDDEQEQEDNEIIDENKCSENDIELLFNRPYHISIEEAISLKKCFILHMSNSRNFEKLAVGTSTASVQIFDIANNGLDKITSIDDLLSSSQSLKKDCNAGNLSGVRFANNDQNILLIGNTKSILQYDLRVKNDPVQTFKDTSDTPKHRIITTFDINQNDRILSVGTEQLGSEAFILFFDVRNPQLLGGYWDGHSEDITQIVFHKSKPDWLASGSVDGLINCYDISKDNENDAFQYCLNTDSSVQQLNWHPVVSNKQQTKKTDLISCITHTNDFHLYDVEESELIVCHDRSSITKDLRRISSMDCNVINCHSMEENDDIFLLAGSNFNGGDCLRSLKIDGKSLLPLTDFKGNKQIIRSSLYNEQKDVLITGGECGIISIWKHGPNIDQNPMIPSLKKIKTKMNKSKHNPY